MTPTEIELHLSGNPEFTRKYGQKVKAAGGRYSECRGDSSIRFVHLPLSCGDLANKLIREYGQTRRGNGRATIIFRGKCESFRESHVHASVVVQEVSKDSADPVSDGYASFRKAFAQAFPASLIPANIQERFKVCRFDFRDDVEVRKAFVDLASLDGRGRVWCDEGPCRGWLILDKLYETEEAAWLAVAEDFERQRDALAVKIADARETARRAAKQPA